MKATTKTRQHTVQIADGKRIKIKSRQKTHCGNLIGYSVWVDGNQFNIFNEVSREGAENAAFAKWVSQQ